MVDEGPRRNIFQRLFGICATPKPKHKSAYSQDNGYLVVDLSRTPELEKRDSALRFEGEDLPIRVLVVHGNDGEFHAFENACSHAKRRLDPVPGGDHVRCCSMGRSTFDYEGNVTGGSAESPIRKLKLIRDDSLLRIKLD